MRFIKILFIVLVIVLFAVFYSQNEGVFTYNFELKLDLWKYMIGPYLTKNIVIILAAFVMGALVTVIYGALQSIGASAESRQKSRRIKELEARVQELSEEKRQKEQETSPFAPTVTREHGTSQDG
ncbi:MAG: LapA family protein [Deltaproteobacteria bacterium]